MFGWEENVDYDGWNLYVIDWRSDMQLHVLPIINNNFHFSVMWKWPDFGSSHKWLKFDGFCMP